RARGVRAAEADPARAPGDGGVRALGRGRREPVGARRSLAERRRGRLGARYRDRARGHARRCRCRAHRSGRDRARAEAEPTAAHRPRDASPTAHADAARRITGSFALASPRPMVQAEVVTASDHLGARGDERDMLNGFLDWYRAVAARKVTGLSFAD